MGTSWVDSGSLLTSRIGWLSAVNSGGNSIVKLETITSDVGIGTATPGKKLSVVGDISASGNIFVSGGPVGSIYTAGSGVDVWGTVIAHEDTSSQASVNNSGENFIQDITLDTFGHITGITSAEASGGGSADTDTQSTVKTFSGDWTWVANNSGSNYGGFDQYGHTETLSAMGDVVASNTLTVSANLIANGIISGNNNATLSGDLIAVGQITAEHLKSSDDIEVGGDVYHEGDTNTYLRFQVDTVNLVAGGKSAIKLDTSTGKIQLNNSNDDLDVQIMSDDSSVILHTDAGTNKVGIGVTDPDQKLTVVGNISARGDVVATGMASISGDLHVGDDLVIKGNNLSINGLNYAWPSSDGSENHVLHTNGAGTLSWAADDGGGGGMTSFQLEDDDGTEVSVSNSEEIKFIGDGIVTNWTDVSPGSDGDPFDMTFSVHQVQSNIVTLTATDLKIGEDNQTKIDFETADTINFYAGNEKQLILTDGALTPGANAIVDLGTDALEFKDAYFDGTVEADAITIGGVTLAETIADTTGAMFTGNTQTGVVVQYVDGDNTLDITLSAAQTTITSLLAADIKIGEDDQTKVDFETANEIHLYANNANKATVHGTGIQLLGHTNELSAMGPAVFSSTTVLSGNTRSTGDITTTGEINSTANIVASGGHTLNHVELGFAVSDETTNLTTGTAKLTFRMPFAMHLTAVRANVNTAPAGSTIIVDINEGGSTILTTKLSIDASEKTSASAAAAAVIGGAGPVLADDAEMKVDIDQIGSSTAGKGLKLWLIGHRI